MRTRVCLVAWVVVLVWSGQACGGKSGDDGPGAGNASGSGGSGGRGGTVSTGGAGGGGAKAGKGGSAGTHQAAGEGGESGEGGAVAAGRDAGGHHAGGESGQGGAGQSGQQGGSCDQDTAGENSLSNVVCATGSDPQSCSELDCVADCTSLTLVRGVADGCGVRCPPEAPIPARQCDQICRSGGEPNVTCGAGLYCKVDDFTQTSYVERCADGADALDCGCGVVPDGCTPSADDFWVCARDGHAYASLCEAHRARTDALAEPDEAVCPPPSDDLYQCGSIFCHKGLEDCVLGDVDDHTPVPSQCVPAGGAGGEGGGP